MKKDIYNNSTKEFVTVDLTADELTVRNAEIAKHSADQQAEDEAKAKKEADALAGNNKLLELGLTQAQVTAMTGYTPPANN